MSTTDAEWLKRWTRQSGETLPKGNARDYFLRIVRFTERTIADDQTKLKPVSVKSG